MAQEQTGAGGVCPGAARCVFAHPGGLNPDPEVDVKHIYAGRKAERWRRAGGVEAAAVGQGGGWIGLVHPPGPGGSWHRAHPKTKALGMLRNLIIRQLLLAWLC